MKLIAGACAVALFLTFAALIDRPGDADDFRGFYRGAQLVGTAAGVYSHPTLSPDTGREGEYQAYVRLPSYAAMLKPLALLPYRTAHRIWVVLIIAAFVALIPLSPAPRDRMPILLCVFLPAIDAVKIGQDIAFVVVIALAARRLILSQREFAAGLLASLLAIKPTYLLPAGIVFLARSRRATYGLALGTAVQVAISFAVGGMRWPAAYLTLLRGPLLDPEPRRMPNLRSIATSLSLPSELFVVASILLLLWLWTTARKLDLADALILALPIGMIASPHSFVYDAVVLAPLLIRVASPDSFGGMAACIAATPLPWVMLMLDRAPAFFPGNYTLLFGSSIAVVATVIAIAQASRAWTPDPAHLPASRLREHPVIAS